MSELNKVRAMREAIQSIATVLSRLRVQPSPWLLPGLLLAVACESDRLKPQPLTDPVETYWDLELNHHAVTLALTAPYDTISLKATPRNFQGTPLSGLPAPVYWSNSPDVVGVSANGTIVALKPAPRVAVYASVTAGNLKHQDSVLVRVVDMPNPPVLTTFSIHPIPPDSAKSAALGALRSTLLADSHAYDLNTLVRATDADGNAMPDLLVDFRSSDPTTADVLFLSAENRPQLLRNRVGMVRLYASVTAFGVNKADTLPYRIGWPLLDIVYIRPATEGSSATTFVGPEVTIGTGGYIVWSNVTNTAVDITFTDPTDVAPFNTSTLFPADFIALQCAFVGADCSAGGSFVMPPAAPDVPFNFVFRSFPTPGTYEYHSAGGASGRIIVVDER